MGMLDRYKKTGGFVQLLTLLETSGKQKQQKFLEIIRQEDPRWADALMSKMIDVDRVLTWNESALAEVTGAMLEINIAAVLNALTPEQREKFLSSMGSIKKRKVLDINESSNASPGDINTSVNKMFETIRKLNQEGTLRFDKFDPLLRIDTDIEDKLKQGRSIEGVPEFGESFGTNADAAEASKEAKEDLSNAPGLRVVTSLDAKAWSQSNQAKASPELEAELLGLRKRVAALQAENGSLRQELTIAQHKLDQIRKIA